MELERLGIAYMVLKPGNTKKKQFTMTINQDRLEKEEWQLLEPHKGLNEVTVSEQDNRFDTYLVLVRADVDPLKKYYFPVSAFSLKK